MPGTDITGCGCDRSQQIGFAESLGKRPRAAACLPSPLVLWFRSLVVRWSISAFRFPWPVKSFAYFTGPWPVKSLAREVFPYFTVLLHRAAFALVDFCFPWPVKFAWPVKLWPRTSPGCFPNFCFSENCFQRFRFSASPPDISAGLCLTDECTLRVPALWTCQRRLVSQYYRHASLRRSSRFHCQTGSPRSGRVSPVCTSARPCFRSLAEGKDQ